MVDVEYAATCRPCPGGGNGGEDRDVAVAEEDRNCAAASAAPGRRADEVDPPHAEGQRGAAETHQGGINRPAVVGHDGPECLDGADQAFAQGDDGQQP
jgi:hypothetical protein